MLSFLADEVRERRNLTPICQNLYRVASALGFAWREGELDFWRLFRARAFGYRRMFVREDATGLFRQARRQDEAGAIPVEAAARFGTQIPLEYAYAAWGKLPAPEAGSHAQQAQLRGFLGVTLRRHPPARGAALPGPALPGTAVHATRTAASTKPPLT